MAEKLVLQYGEKSVYVDNNNGNIYINRFATDAERAFVDGSFDLEMYKPSINPPIKRAENVSTKVVKIIQSYVGIVNKMVWRK